MDFVFVSLHNSFLGKNEITGSGYSRAVITDPEICEWFYTTENNDDSKFKNDIDVSFPEAGDDWGNIWSIAIWSLVTEGEQLFCCDLKTPYKIKKKDKFKIKINDIKTKGYVTKKKKKKKETKREENFYKVRIMMKIIEKASSSNMLIEKFKKIDNPKIQQLIKKKKL